MSDEIFDATIRRLRQHCELTGQRQARLGFHGGEPCLVGVERFSRWCGKTREALGGIDLHINIQTNGTLLNEDWIKAFMEHDVEVGISIDGPKKVHDVSRVDLKGWGSYDRVIRGLSLLKLAKIRHGVLCVIPLGADPLAVHRHFVELGCPRVTYILPDFTHDTIQEVRKRYGETPCGDFLIQVFDEWWFNGTLEIHVADLWNVARVILGGDSIIETIGNRPPAYVFVETDGEMEGLDSLRVCKEGASQIGLNVLSAGFHEIVSVYGMHGTAIFRGMPLPGACRGCAEEGTCAGGYLPHRYSAAGAFDNPSVWCADMLKLFAHLRLRLGVTPEETRARRQELLGEKMKAQLAQRAGRAAKTPVPAPNN
jgi:uncharacterized protein